MRHDVLLQARCFWGSLDPSYCDTVGWLSRPVAAWEDYRMQIIRQGDYREGRWRNGVGVSWDIAGDPPGSEDFGWRFAIARIEKDVPFSEYPHADRIFTLIEGDGLDLDFAGRPSLAVERLFVPHPYPCDVPTFCRLRGGPCRALNLFTRRNRWSATADILSSTAEISHAGPILLFALSGSAGVNGQALVQGDSAIAEGQVKSDTEGFLFAARLWRE
jgi:environmental stress-induced protein Ves